IYPHTRISPNSAPPPLLPRERENQCPQSAAPGVPVFAGTSPSVGVSRGHLPRDLGTFLEIAANDQLRRRRAGAVALLIAAVPPIEARDHAQAPVSARGFGVDD